MSFAGRKSPLRVFTVVWWVNNCVMFCKSYALISLISLIVIVTEMTGNDDSPAQVILQFKTNFSKVGHFLELNLIKRVLMGLLESVTWHLRTVVKGCQGAVVAAWMWASVEISIQRQCRWRASCKSGRWIKPGIWWGPSLRSRSNSASPNGTEVDDG